MTPCAAVTVSFRDADTGATKERIISVKDMTCRTDDDIKSDAIWIVQSWRGVDRDSVTVSNIERAHEIAARIEANQPKRATA